MSYKKVISLKAFKYRTPTKIIYLFEMISKNLKTMLMAEKKKCKVIVFIQL